MGHSRIKLEYCCHFYTGGTQSTLSSLDRVQNLLCTLVGDELFSSLHQKSSFPSRPNISHLSLHYRHLHGKWWDDDNVPLFSTGQLRILTAKNRQLYRTDTHMDTSPTSLGSVLIYPPYPSNLHFQLPPVMSISHC